MSYVRSTPYTHNKSTHARTINHSNAQHRQEMSLTMYVSVSLLASRSHARMRTHVARLAKTQDGQRDDVADCHSNKSTAAVGRRGGGRGWWWWWWWAAKRWDEKNESEQRVGKREKKINVSGEAMSDLIQSTRPEEIALHGRTTRVQGAGLLQRAGASAGTGETWAPRK